MNTLYKRILLFGIVAMLVFSPIARGAVRVWSVTPLLLISYFLIFLWLWRANNEPGYKFKPTNLDKPIILFSVLAVISFIFSIYKHDSFFAFVKLFGYIGVYYLVANEFSRAMRKRLIGLVICMGTGLSAYGILQYFGVLSHPWWFPQNFLASTYVNHNHFAGYLELVMPLSLCWFFSRRHTFDKRLGVKVFLLVGIIVMLFAFILSQSRGAWVSLIASFGIISVLVIKKSVGKKNITLTIVLVALLLAAISYFAVDTIYQRIHTSDEGQGFVIDETRLKIWEGAMHMIKKRPLIGVGIGDFDRGFYRYRPCGLNAKAVYAHNDYLHIAAEMGLFAPVFIIWMLVIIIKAGFRNITRPKVIGATVGVLSLALHGLIDFNFHIPANMLLFILYSAFIMRQSEKE